MARSRLLGSVLPKNLPDTPSTTAQTLDLTIYNLHRGTKLVACLSTKRNPEYSRMDMTYEHMVQQARYEQCKS